MLSEWSDGSARTRSAPAVDGRTAAAARTSSQTRYCGLSTREVITISRTSARPRPATDDVPSASIEPSPPGRGEASTARPGDRRAHHHRTAAAITITSASEQAVATALASPPSNWSDP